MLSRIADSMYWMARSLERADNTARLLNINLLYMLDSPNSLGLIGTRPTFDLDPARATGEFGGVFVGLTFPPYRPDQSSGDFGVGQGQVPGVMRDKAADRARAKIRDARRSIRSTAGATRGMMRR